MFVNSNVVENAFGFFVSGRFFCVLEVWEMRIAGIEKELSEIERRGNLRSVSDLRMLSATRGVDRSSVVFSDRLNHASIIDGCRISGAKVVVYEHNDMKSQIDRFSHCMLAGLSHDPVERLSEKLEIYLPGDLNHFFFSDSGSVGVEVALKMAMQFNRNRGRTEGKSSR